MNDEKELKKDLKDYYEAMEEFIENPKTYTLDEVEQELGLKE